MYGLYDGYSMGGKNYTMSKAMSIMLEALGDPPGAGNSKFQEGLGHVQLVVPQRPKSLSVGVHITL